MKNNKLAKPLLFSLCSLLLGSQSPAIQAASNSNPAAQSLGNVSFPSSCQSEAQPRLERGLALLHHMMYAEALKEFSALAAAHPNCSLAHWGMAMTHFKPLWPGRPSPEALRKGANAVAQALARQPQDPREQAYIAAAAAFFNDWKNVDHATRIAAWEKAQKKLYEDNPDDMNAAALYALSHLATAPKADKTFSHQKTAGALLEQLYRQESRHPGVIHYTIHAYDNPMLAARAETVARAYDKIAPEVPHALHMPTHIFVRLGIWPDTISWNIRSAQAALNFPVQGNVSHHYPHAEDYLIYAYLQQADETKARGTLASLDARNNYQPTFVSGYALASMPARFALERKQWSDAAQLPLRKPNTFPWEKFPQVEAFTYFARALGAARSGKLSAAKQNLNTLTKLLQRTQEAGQIYWATLIEAQHKAISAWVSYAEGDKEQALAMLQGAADQEDSVDKHPVTPGSVLPVRELLGDMLLLEGNNKAALAAYEASLKISPNRYYSLHGAGRAAELAGNAEKARQYYSQLVELSGNNGANREELAQAQAFLKNTN